MKTRIEVTKNDHYVVVEQESNSVCGDFRTLDEARELQEKLENTRTGKTSRAVFLALSKDKDVVLVCDSQTRSRYVHIPFVLAILDSLAYPYEYSVTKRQVSYFGKDIYFRGQEEVNKILFKPSTTELIYDID